MQLGRNDEARVAFDRAIALANTSAEAAHIRMHLDRLMRDSRRPTLERDIPRKRFAFLSARKTGFYFFRGTPQKIQKNSCPLVGSRLSRSSQ